MSSFRAFIQSLLKTATIDDEYVKILTGEPQMKIFQDAFTHKSFDPNNNYELLEIVGDGIIKGILTQYIVKKFPKQDLLKWVPEIKQETDGQKGLAGVVSKIRRNLEQSKSLSGVALKLGFWEFVKGDEKTITQDRNKTLEDVFEGFIGALTEVIDSTIRDGLGYYYAKNFVNLQLDTLDLTITPEMLDDPITRLNELYKANVISGGKPPLKWGDAKYTDTQLSIPRVSTLPKTGNTGDLVFNGGDNTVYGFYKGSWIHHSKLPVDLVVQPEPKKTFEYTLLVNNGTGELKDYFQRMWVVSVKSGGNNPQVIGRAISFKKANSKMESARQALEYLKSIGIYK